MPREGLEAADVFRRFGPKLSGKQHGASLSGRAPPCVMIAIESCRTAVLGGHVERCSACGHQRIAYDSGRNRNCPKELRAWHRAQWIADRQAELLDVPHFQCCVHRADGGIEVIAFQNQMVIADILTGRRRRRCALALPPTPEHLGAEIGIPRCIATRGDKPLLQNPHLRYLALSIPAFSGEHGKLVFRGSPLAKLVCRAWWRRSMIVRMGVASRSLRRISQGARRVTCSRFNRPASTSAFDQCDD